MGVWRVCRPESVVVIGSGGCGASVAGCAFALSDTALAGGGGPAVSELMLFAAVTEAVRSMVGMSRFCR